MRIIGLLALFALVLVSHVDAFKLFPTKKPEHYDPFRGFKPLDGPTYELESGKINCYTADGLNICKGIPYAAPPVGDFRFRPTQKVTPWTNALTTWVPKSPCPQIHITDSLFLGDEDCLYANIYVPENATISDPLPVMFWIYGGGYVFGDGYEFGLYDGQNLAKNKNVIVVTFNYRLGPLGFLALDQLKSDNPSGTIGNWALLDQQYMLGWVQRNIKTFGGDPNRVTIYGESAGAFSVCWHLAAPGSNGLFASAIMESGTCDSPQFFTPAEQTIAFGETYSSIVGCDPNSDDLLFCLRGLSTGAIMGQLLGPWPTNATDLPALWPIMPWGPTIDKVALTDVPLFSIQNGNWNKVPLIIGTNKDEGTIFVPMLGFVMPGKISFPLTTDDLPVMLGHFFGNNQTLLDKILLQYPSYKFSSPTDIANTCLRDFFFACSSRRVVDAITSQGLPAYLYHFAYKGDWIEDPLVGDYHSAELEFVFDNQWPPLIHIFSDNDQTIADAFNTYWTNLAISGNPNLPSAPVQWPAYNTTDRMNLVFEIPVSLETDLLKDTCDFWDNVPNYPSQY